MIHRRDFIRRSVLGFGGLSLAGPGRTAQPAAPRFLRQWGSKGSEPGEFHFPIGIAINAADEVFVTDFYNERVQKFNADGKLLAVIEVLPGCGGIAIGRNGYEVLTLPDVADVDEAKAKLHQETLKHFWDHVTATNAINENEQGGFKLLVRQMADAIGIGGFPSEWEGWECVSCRSGPYLSGPYLSGSRMLT